jgi:hypothetical protein
MIRTGVKTHCGMTPGSLGGSLQIPRPYLGDMPAQYLGDIDRGDWFGLTEFLQACDSFDSSGRPTLNPSRPVTYL